MGYIVGLMATDGCLISNRRHLNFKSADEQLVRTFLECLGRPMRYSRIVGKTGNFHYVVQFGDVRFYKWLETVGLMPRKSLILGGIGVPDEFLLAVLRGRFDGDGHISSFVHYPTRSTYPTYRYERLWVFFNSASRPHLEWIRSKIAGAVQFDGFLEKLAPREGRRDFFRLKYGNHASAALLKAIYPTADVPKLERKWKIWEEYAKRHELREACADGGTRTRMGLHPPPPEDGASTNWATSAWGQF